jgi:hypothetical protein
MAGASRALRCNPLIVRTCGASNVYDHRCTAALSDLRIEGANADDGIATISMMVNGTGNPHQLQEKLETLGGMLSVSVFLSDLD